MLETGRSPVTLVDFDFIEPFYTLRPLKKELEEKGLHVLAWETRNTMGLGEAGTLVKPEMRWALRRAGDVIFDVGYGVQGAKKLRLVEEVPKEGGIIVYVVINIARPLTGSLEDIVEYVRSLGPVDGLINNSHLGDDTELAIIQEGARIVSQAACLLGIPLKWTMAEKRFAEQLGEKDCRGNPVFYLERYMNRTFW